MGKDFAENVIADDCAVGRGSVSMTMRPAGAAALAE